MFLATDRAFAKGYKQQRWAREGWKHRGSDRAQQTASEPWSGSADLSVVTGFGDIQQ